MSVLANALIGLKPFPPKATKTLQPLIETCETSLLAAASEAQTYLPIGPGACAGLRESLNQHPKTDRLDRKLNQNIATN